MTKCPITKSRVCPGGHLCICYGDGPERTEQQRKEMREFWDKESGWTEMIQRRNV